MNKEANPNGMMANTDAVQFAHDVEKRLLFRIFELEQRVKKLETFIENLPEYGNIRKG